jgi:hypothetical protein
VARLHNTLFYDSNYNLLKERCTEDHLANLIHMHEYGNHKSATSLEGIILATTSLHDDVLRQRAIPILPSHIDELIGFEICPLGIAQQYTINELGEMIDKHLACHDHTYHSGPSNLSLNLCMDKSTLVPCQYGHCLWRVIHQVHFLHHDFPDTPILLSKADLDAAYRRVTSIWHLAIQCICVVGHLASILLRLPFSAAAAPSEFCVISEMICDIANQLLQDPTWDPGDIITPWDHLLPPPVLLDPSIPFGQACTLDVTPQWQSIL